MSGLLGLLLVSVSVGLSNFAGAIGIGLTGSTPAPGFGSASPSGCSKR